MSVPPAESVPSVFSTFRQPTDTLNIIHHQKTVQYAKPAPYNVNFPGGNASFPAVSPQTLIFSNAIQSFTKALAEALETPVLKEPEKQTPNPLPPITHQAAQTLKQAFETLQEALHQGVKLLPEAKEPLPKALVQVLIQTPVLLKQLQESLPKPLARLPVIEEAEVPVKLQEPFKEEKKGLEELRRNLPGFVKTLQTALEQLPKALPPEIKEALEKYLQSPTIQKNLPPQKEELRLPVELPKTQPLPEKPELPVVQNPPLQEIPVKLELPKVVVKPVLPEVNNQTLPKQPLLEKEAPLITQPSLEKKEVQVLPKSIVQPEIIEKPMLLELPKLALKEVLENFFPLLKNLLELIQKEKVIPQELLALLKQMPIFIEQLKQLFMKEPALLSFEEKELLKMLKFSIPNLFESIKAELGKLPKAVPAEVKEKIENLVNKFPLQKVVVLLEKQVNIPSKVIPELLTEETSVPTSEVPVHVSTVVSTPLVIVPFVPEEMLLEGEEVVLLEKRSSEAGKAHPYHAGEGKETSEKGTGSRIQSPVSLPMFTVSQFQEQMKEPPRQPEFSTEIPFAFIVPYVPNTPIHSNAGEVKITPPDPWKETHREEVGGGGKKSVQVLSYVPKGETWYGDPLSQGEFRKFSLNSFAIGVYLVTNEQFAVFLTQQSKLKKILVGERGQIFSKDKTLLCQIKSGNVESNIESEPEAQFLSFRASSGKESYPVVCVTYEGAKAFCEAGGFRLPTEVEWEKAASLEMTEKNTVSKKFRFGCSQDEITPNFANYNAGTSFFDTLTTPVGFYNGKTSFMREGVVIQTVDAKSPFGCYDMSGNVFEWTVGESGRFIVKGGCFSSPQEDLRVFVKKEKERDFLDGCTGFRVALS